MTSVQQYDLFGNVEISAAIAYPWSHSRINSLESCPLKYFYQYYGSKKRFALNIPNKKRIELLSHLGNEYLIGGTIVHDSIDFYFKQGKKGITYNLEMLLSWAINKLDAAIDLSEKARLNNEIELEASQKIFKEIFYLKEDKGRFREKLKDKIVKNLTNFYESENFEFLRKGGKTLDSFLEKWVIFVLRNYSSIKGKIDLAFYDASGKFLIADWKTGNPENEETSLQLLIYSIWAMHHQQIPKENIKLAKAYLQENTVEFLEFTNEHLIRAEMKVIQNTEAIAILHQYGINGKIEAFTGYKEKIKVCLQCPFEEICHKK